MSFIERGFLLLVVASVSLSLATNGWSETILKQKDRQINSILGNNNSIALYQPNYFMPVYYMNKVYPDLYGDIIPNHQQLTHTDFRFQISVQMPIIVNLFSRHNSLHFAYTQQSFWQSYVESPYFRETNYMPELFFKRIESNHFGWQAGVVHQSNGRGGKQERSWNRYYGQLMFSGKHWLAYIKGWGIVTPHENEAIQLNPDIGHYLGYESVLLSYQWQENVISFYARNTFESGFSRSAESYSWSFPLHQRLRGYLYVFNGYGQDLIEYNKQTLGVGLGISFNDWI